MPEVRRAKPRMKPVRVQHGKPKNPLKDSRTALLGALETIDKAKHPVAAVAIALTETGITVYASGAESDAPHALAMIALAQRIIVESMEARLADETQHERAH